MGGGVGCVRDFEIVDGCVVVIFCWRRPAPPPIFDEGTFVVVIDFDVVPLLALEPSIEVQM